jgi:hypothetical protein
VKSVSASLIQVPSSHSTGIESARATPRASGFVAIAREHEQGEARGSQVIDKAGRESLDHVGRIERLLEDILRHTAVERRVEQHNVVALPTHRLEQVANRHPHAILHHVEQRD